MGLWFGEAKPRLVARVAPAARGFVVDIVMPVGDPDATKAIDLAVRELRFYLVELGDPNPWAYAAYHCTTAANLYSDIRWVDYPFGANADGSPSQETPPEGTTATVSQDHVSPGNPPLPALVEALRRAPAHERITLRPAFFAFGATCVDSLVDVALEVPDLTASVASWLEALANQQPDARAAAIDGLKDLTDSASSYIVRACLERLGVATRPARRPAAQPRRSVAEGEVHARIIKAAREGRTVYYSDLETSRGHIGKYLFNISNAEAEQGHPPLTAIVIGKATGRPGGGFLPAMIEVGFAERGEPLDVVWERAVRDVHAFWRKNE